MIRCLDTPILPGFTLKKNLRQSRFHKPHHLEWIGNSVPYITDKDVSGIGGEWHQRPSTYPKVCAKTVSVGPPPWLAFDKQVLTFDGYYEEPIQDVAGYNRIVHKCKIYYFLEDGTIKVVEPKVVNSGISQGCLISKQRIKIPEAGDDEDIFYDMYDFNVGQQMIFFGKKFIITDCDLFTRQFITKLGVGVPESIPLPDDPYTVLRNKAQLKLSPKVPEPQTSNLDKFLTLDGKVLHFDGVWDDRQHEFGFLHSVKLYYYLKDDTIEILDNTDRKRSHPIVKRMKLPKEYHTPPIPGMDSPISILNVVGRTSERSHYVRDPLNTGASTKEYYLDKDLCIGAVMNVFGKDILLTQCDKFTEEFYRAKYGIEDFTPISIEEDKPKVTETDKQTQELPPFNGFGSLEDSELNCKTVFPFKITKSYRKFFENDRDGYDSKVLRFSCILLSKVESEQSRKFLLSYYLSDDTLSVYELERQHSGFKKGLGGMIISRRKILKPGQKLTDQSPQFYGKDDLYVGNILTLDNFKFLLTGADEYALTYMENLPNEFPKSNFVLILDKLRQSIKTKYKNFIAQFFVNGELTQTPYSKFQDAVKQVLEDKITNHEIQTLARKMSIGHPQEKFNLEELRSYAQDALKRHLFQDFQRLKERLMQNDSEKCEFLSKEQIYSTMRGARVPLDKNLLRLILDKFAEKSEGKIKYESLIHYLNYKDNPANPIAPINLSANTDPLFLSRISAAESQVWYVDINKLIEELQLEEELKKQSG